MFRKTVRFHALLAGCILLAGCAGKTAEEKIPSSAQNESNSSIMSEVNTEHPLPISTPEPAGEAAGGENADADASKAENVPDEPEDASPAQEEKKPRPEAGERKLCLDMYCGRIMRAGEEQLLVYGDKEILLLDMYTLDVIKRVENKEYMGNLPSGCQVWELEDGGYIVSGTVYDETGRPWVMIPYDSELQAGNTLNLNETLHIDQETGRSIVNHGYEFIDNEQKLLYTMDNKFYIYDFRSDEIIEIAAPKDIRISSFIYLEDLNQILLKGLNENHQKVIARMDMNGEILDVNSEHYYGELWDFQSFVLIEENPPVGAEGEGVFFYYDTADGGIQSFPLLESDKDTVRIREKPSDGGKYYIAYGPSLNNAQMYELHIYSSEDGSLTGEVSLSCEEFGENFNITGISVDDETERLIVVGRRTGREETWIVSRDLYTQE